MHCYDLRVVPYLEGPAETYRRLLSSSMDQSICVWTFEPSSNVWIVETRLGDVIETSSGFYGACWSPDARQILAYGHSGGFYRWKKPEGKLNVMSDSVPNQISDHYHESRSCWIPEYAISGHFAAVKDVAWDPSGAYFISVR